MGIFVSLRYKKMKALPTMNCILTCQCFDCKCLSAVERAERKAKKAERNKLLNKIAD